MKILRKIVLRFLVNAGLVDKVGDVKGPLAVSKAINKVRPKLAGKPANIVQTYKGRMFCKVRVNLEEETDSPDNYVLYDAIVLTSKPKEVTGDFTTPVTGGFKEGDPVIIKGWDGNSLSQLEVMPLNVEEVLRDRQIVTQLLGAEGTIITVYPNFFCLVRIGPHLVEAKYEGIGKPTIKEIVKVINTISTQITVAPK